MPVLPSGRRIEFSLDRFLAMLDRLDERTAVGLADALEQPDDLLPVVDVVHFDADGNNPYFAGYVAADWEQHARDWTIADRQALRQHLAGEVSQSARAEAIVTLHRLLARPQPTVAAPAVPATAHRAAA